MTLSIKLTEEMHPTCTKMATLTVLLSVAVACNIDQNLFLFAPSQGMMARIHFVRLVLNFPPLEICNFFIKASSLLIHHSFLVCHRLLHFVKLSMEFLLSFFQLSLFFLNSENKFLSHLFLSFLQRMKMTLPSHRVSLSKTAGLSFFVTFLETHLLQPILTIQFVVLRVSAITQILHVGSDKHLSQPREVAVVFILHLNHSPWILPSSNFFTSNLDKLVATNNSKRKMLIVISVSLSHGLIFHGKLI